MKLDTKVHKGRMDKPAIIFIHGLGMDKKIWTKPEDARILGGNFPLRFLLPEKPAPVYCGSGKKILEIRHSRFSVCKTERDLKTSFDDLKSLKYTVIAWSQKRPAAAISIAAKELKEVIEISKKYSRAGIILIGHSRGGLIARKYLESRDRAVKGLITIATPHRGSTIAKWAEFISPLTSIMSPLVREEDKKKFTYTMKRILDFMGSRAVGELLPDSEFFHSLRSDNCGRRHCLSFGGTNPCLLSVYRWRLKVTARRGAFRWVLEPEVLFSIPEMLEKIIPKKYYPPELKNGYGDGLVSSKSSVLPHCREHFDLDANHASILFDERVRKKIVEAVKGV